MMITPPKWKTIPKVEGQNEQKVILGQLRRDRKTRRTTLPQPMSGAKIPGRAAPESIPVYPGSGAKAPASGAIPDTVVDRDSADKKRGGYSLPHTPPSLASMISSSFFPARRAGLHALLLSGIAWGEPAGHTVRTLPMNSIFSRLWIFP